MFLRCLNIFHFKAVGGPLGSREVIGHSLCKISCKSNKKCSRRSDDRHADWLTDASDFITCPMLYAIAMRQITLIIMVIVLVLTLWAVIGQWFILRYVLGPAQQHKS